MAEIQLKAEKRTIFKKSTARTYRKTGFIPGIFYGTGDTSIPIAISELSLRPIIFTNESHIVNLEIEGESKPFSCILKDVQFDPIQTRPIHFDLMALTEGESITIEVNVQLTGVAPGIKEGGILQHILHKLDIECLPQFIPSRISVDISNLGINDSLKVSDIKLEGIQILNDENAAIVSVLPPTVVEEEAKPEVAAEAAVAEPEVISKGKKEKEEE
jgi:large subunit ribosomal protein L25